MLQIYLGLAWIVGCSIFGLLVVKNSVECRIARQYLCQTAMFMCGLSMLILTTIEGNYQAYLLFVWIYGGLKIFKERKLKKCFVAPQVFLLAATITRLKCSLLKKFEREISLELGALCSFLR